MRGDLELGIAARSSEDPVQEPAMRAGRWLLAVAGAEDPEALAGLVLDAEIVAHRASSASRFHHSPKTRSGRRLASRGAAMPRQVKLDRRMVGQQRHGLDRLRMGQQARRARPVVRPGSAGRPEPAARSA